MEETVEHLVGIPGYDVVEEEMNKVDSAAAQSESESLFPVGTDMMESNDAEVDANGDKAKMNTDDCADGSESFEGHQLPGDGLQPSNVIIGNSGPDGATPNDVLRAMPRACDQSDALTSPSGDEVAMPIQGSAPGEPAPEELGDLESVLPMSSYDSEAEFTPSPSPSPSSIPPPVRVSRHTAMALVDLAETDAKAFDPTDVKGNFLSLVAHCTKAVSEGFDTSAQGVSNLSASLSKYASALECAQSANFPSCMPAEASQIIQSPPENGRWSCF